LAGTVKVSGGNEPRAWAERPVEKHVENLPFSREKPLNMHIALAWSGVQA